MGFFSQDVPRCNNKENKLTSHFQTASSLAEQNKWHTEADVSTVEDNNNNTLGANEIEEEEYESPIALVLKELINDPILTSGLCHKISSTTSGVNAPPEPRWGHSSSMVQGSEMLVYGGEAEVGENNKNNNHDDEPLLLGDVNVFALETLQWKRTVGCSGKPRAWHSATYLPSSNHLLVFGGVTEDGLSNEAMVFDCCIELWYPLTCSGAPPLPRKGHSAVLLDKFVCVFGGHRMRNGWLNDVALLDTARWRWIYPEISGQAPEPRVYHQAVVVPPSSANQKQQSMVVFGGNGPDMCFNSVHVLTRTRFVGSNANDADVFGVGTWSWSSPIITGIPPAPRCGHTAVMADDEERLIVYGGWDTDAPGHEDSEESVIVTFNDLCVLNTTTWTWETRIENTGGAALTGHAAQLVPLDDTPAAQADAGMLVVFGGQSNAPECKRTNEVFLLAVPAPGSVSCDVTIPAPVVTETRQLISKITATEGMGGSVSNTTTKTHLPARISALSIDTLDNDDCSSTQLVRSASDETQPLTQQTRTRNRAISETSNSSNRSLLAKINKDAPPSDATPPDLASPTSRTSPRFGKVTTTPEHTSASSSGRQRAKDVRKLTSTKNTATRKRRPTNAGKKKAAGRAIDVPLSSGRGRLHAMFDKMSQAATASQDTSKDMCRSHVEQGREEEKKNSTVSSSANSSKNNKNQTKEQKKKKTVSGATKTTEATYSRKRSSSSDEEGAGDCVGKKEEVRAAALHWPRTSPRHGPQAFSDELRDHVFQVCAGFGLPSMTAKAAMSRIKKAKCTDLQMAMNIVLDLADSPASSVAIKRQRRVTLGDSTNIADF